MINKVQVNSVQDAVDGVMYKNTDSSGRKTMVQKIQVMNVGDQAETIEMWIREITTGRNVVCLAFPSTSIGTMEGIFDTDHIVMPGQEIYYSASSDNVLVEINLSEEHF